MDSSSTPQISEPDSKVHIMVYSIWIWFSCCCSLQEEKLEGANRYSCDNCKSKQDATRRIQLLELPPVLNVQLLRFVFDR